MPVEIDLLLLENASITAPAGCGKTELIADALRRHSGQKPILVLTHTNAGVAALRGRLDRGRVPSAAYRMSTIDGWAIRLAAMFPKRSGLDPATMRKAKPDYEATRDATIRLLRGGHIQEILRATYAKLFVDEYQDCTVPQHELICHAATSLPTVVLGDPLQAIFNFANNRLPDWNGEVCGQFPLFDELKTPWRWTNAGTEALGRWLLDIRADLQAGRTINLSTAPREVEWVRLDPANEAEIRRRASRTRGPYPGAKVIVLGDKWPSTNRRIASESGDGIAVEAVDLRDMVDFAAALDFSRADDALSRVLHFAGSLMTNVEPINVLSRVAVLLRGTQRTEASDVELAALDFRQAPSASGVSKLLSAISAVPNVRAYRDGMLRATFRALNQCDGTVGNSFAETAIKVRELNRVVGRPLAKRSVGSTLLLKGLEAEVAVVLYADEMNARNLYVAMTRGSRKLVVCSRSPELRPR